MKYRDFQKKYSKIPLLHLDTLGGIPLYLHLPELVKLNKIEKSQQNGTISGV